MYNTFYSLCFFVSILVAPPILAQSPPKEALRFAYLDEKVSEDLIITRERIFEGPGLFGFMNGGAELFLEYGFQQMLEQRLTYQNIPFIIEYYLMDHPENAYGIYSVHAFKCRRTDERFPFECVTPGLLQLYHGYLYITLKCMDKATEAQPILDTLATLIIHTNPISEGVQSTYLDATPPPRSGILYYVCGDLGLSAAHISWAQLFAPYTHYTMWLRIDKETGEATAHISFASANDAETFCSQNEGQLLVKREGKEVFIQTK